jgi:hypothetical protein
MCRRQREASASAGSYPQYPASGTSYSTTFAMGSAGRTRITSDHPTRCSAVLTSPCMAYARAR